MVIQEDYNPYNPMSALFGNWTRQWRALYANKILPPGNVTHLPGTNVLERQVQEINRRTYPTWMGLPIALHPQVPKGQVVLHTGKPGQTMIVFHDTYDLHAARFWISLTPELALLEMEAEKAWQDSLRWTTAMI
jgi:hypothetical protein